MLVIIRDRYYRDSPESIALSAFVSDRDHCRFTCQISFKASHAPEDAGDARRPPQTLQLVCRGDLLEDWLRSSPQDSLPATASSLLPLVEACITVTTSSRRWKTVKLSVRSHTRHALELSVTQPNGAEVATIYWPLGVFIDMRRALTGILGKRGHSGLVITWDCEPYVYSLAARAQTLD